MESSQKLRPDQPGNLSVAEWDRDPATGPREWLLTDRRGGFASSTALFCPARRYHGLLVLPLPGTARRYLFVAGFDESVHAADGSFELSRRRHGGDGPAVPPAALVDFQATPWPRTRFRQGSWQVTREVLLPVAAGAVLVRYAVDRVDGTTAAGPAELRLRPRLPLREADSLTFCNDVLQAAVEPLADGIRCRPYQALPAVEVRVATTGSWEFRADPDWDLGVEYELDLARGYDGHEDLFAPGEFVVRLQPGDHVVVAATLGGDLEPAAAWTATAAERAAPAVAGLRARCQRAAGDFLYHSAAPDRPGTGRLGVLAGFPWFGEWGRDTFIALPGLTLARGRPADCAAVLRGVLGYLDDGLVPNIFGTGRHDSHYGSVDAALWFARAVLLYDRARGAGSAGDPELPPASEFLPALVSIAEAYAAGTAPRIRALGIRGDDAGLLQAGDASLNPTWMDARPSSGAVTPRHGCPVEIAALWYSLLRHVAELAARQGDDRLHQRFADHAARAGAAFVARFWLPADGYLADVWRPEQVDRSVRPNMVLAAALEFSPLDRDQRALVLARAAAELLTPVGLRTLSPRHPDYVGRYAGDVERRDRAYHQGTVWPWLLGSYVETALRVRPAAAPELRALLDGLVGELDRCGLEHISEVFDGDPPHRPGGTFAQAWNTAEVLRASALLDGDLPLGGAGGLPRGGDGGRQR